MVISKNVTLLFLKHSSQNNNPNESKIAQFKTKITETQGINLQKL